MLDTEKAVFQYIFQEKITYQNYQKHKNGLLAFFKEEAACDAFVEKYLSHVMLLHIDDFIAPDQAMDAFPVVRNQADCVLMQDFYELKYIVKGKAYCIIDQQSFLLEQSDLCLIRPQSCQQMLIFDNDCMAVVLVIRKEKIHTIFPRLFRKENPIADFFSAPADNEDNGCFLHASTNNDGEIQALILDIYRYFHNSKEHDPAQDILREIKTELVLMKLLANYADHIFSSRDLPAESHIAYEILAYIRENLTSVTLDNLAERLGYSHSYTSHFFKKYMGESFRSILQTLRMERARQLLETTGIGIEEIMYQVGYSGKTNFYNIFKQKYGVTPKEYRLKAKDIRSHKKDMG